MPVAFKKDIEQGSDIRNDLFSISGFIAQIITKCELFFTVTHFINAYILPDILTQYSKKYPHIQLTNYEKSAKNLEIDLLQQKIDVTLSCDVKLLDIRK